MAQPKVRVLGRQGKLHLHESFIMHRTCSLAGGPSLHLYPEDVQWKRSRNMGILLVHLTGFTGRQEQRGDAHWGSGVHAPSPTALPSDHSLPEIPTALTFCSACHILATPAQTKLPSHPKAGTARVRGGRQGLLPGVGGVRRPRSHSSDPRV